MFDNFRKRKLEQKIKKEEEELFIRWQKFNEKNDLDDKEFDNTKLLFSSDFLHNQILSENSYFQKKRLKKQLNSHIQSEHKPYILNFNYESSNPSSFRPFIYSFTIDIYQNKGYFQIEVGERTEFITLSRDLNEFRNVVESRIESLYKRSLQYDIFSLKLSTISGNRSSKGPQLRAA